MTPAVVKRILAAGAFASSCAMAQGNGDVDRLSSLVVQALPMGELFQVFVDRDPKWPLLTKADRVSSEKLDCMRARLSRDGYAQIRRDEVANFARRHPQRIEESIRVLSQGGAEMAAASFNAGLEEARSGLKVDYSQVMNKFSPTQAGAFLELIGDDKHRALRELIGIDDAISLNASGAKNEQSGRNKGRMMGMKLMLSAMQSCNVPLSAVQ